MDMINFDGLLIGIATFLIIGLFHPVVVKAEYYWGTKCWWIFLVLGIAGTVASLLVESVFVSAICGVFAFSSFWTIKEVFEQEERVLKAGFQRIPNVLIRSKSLNQAFQAEELVTISYRHRLKPILR